MGFVDLELAGRETANKAPLYGQPGVETPNVEFLTKLDMNWRLSI